MSDIVNGEIKDTKTMKEHFASGTPAKAYLLFGEEEYLKDIYLKRIKALCVDDPINIYNFTGKPDNSQISDIFEGLSLFGDRKLIVIRDSGFFRSADPIRFLSNIEESDSTFVLFIETNVDKRTKNYKDFSKIGIIFECRRQDEASISAALTHAASVNGNKITPGAIGLLISGIGNDLSRLSSEVDKLSLYAGKGNVIDERHVREVCSLSVSGKIFDLTDAVISGNRNKAFIILDALLQDRTESALGILSLVSRCIVQIYEIKRLKESGKSKDVIQTEMGLHPFVIKKYIEAGSKWADEILKKKIKLCLQLDDDIKSGKISERCALEVLVL